MGLYSEGDNIYGRAYIRDVNWVAYLGGVYPEKLIYGGDVLTGFYGICNHENNVPSRLSSQWLCKTHALAQMMYSYTMLVPMNQIMLNKPSKEGNMSGHK